MKFKTNIYWLIRRHKLVKLFLINSEIGRVEK